MRANKNPLSVDFLYELYNCVLTDEMICSAVVQHIKKEYLPDRSFQDLHIEIASHYSKYGSSPSIALVRQAFNGDGDVEELINTILDSDIPKNTDAVIDMLEEYIRGVRLQQVYVEVGKLYNKGGHKEAQNKLAKYAEWSSSFTLKPSQFVDVIGTFGSRFQMNRIKNDDSKKQKQNPVTRFYIDQLDLDNGGRSLRGQLTCFLASTGVGKSHAARHIGSSACVMDGLNVLHFQLEGSEDEVLNAYSGSLIGRNAFLFEKGKISDKEMSELEKTLKDYSGSIAVRSFPRFNNKVTTLDVSNGIDEYIKTTGKKPDIVIIDSMDILQSCTAKFNDDRPERMKRTEVANDLKDLASDKDVWIVATYQATIEDRQWLNDENNVLTEYNCSEAKGLSRPLTHLITLNQSEAERKENYMRIHVAKSRFFKKGGTYKIATDYDNEVFYDHQRSTHLINVK